jgi:hypothetical protein
MKLSLTSGRIGWQRAHSLARVPSWIPWIIACFACTGCELVKGIFKAGVWTGVLAVFAVIALAIWGLTKLARR